MYIHFTSQQDAEAIVASMTLWPCSWLKSVLVDEQGKCILDEDGCMQADPNRSPAYAVSVEHNVYYPPVQRTKLGRPTNRDYAVLFTTSVPPSNTFEEETIWEVPHAGLPLTGAMVITAEEAVSLLRHA